jgi:hypothetical protein
MAVIWELDFYSRPLLDETERKIWEVLICEKPQQIEVEVKQLFRYQQYCPSTQVNSVWLAKALQAAIAKATVPPAEIRFFRRQMTNMITKACQDLGLEAKLSRRTVALNYWLQDRYAQVYPQEPGYQPQANPSVQYAPGPAQPLPDALQGTAWRSVTLATQDFQDFSEWQVSFGDIFPLNLIDLDPTTPIPGLLIFSQRALPLAAWMSGLELAFLSFESQPRPNFILETGASDRWVIASLPRPELQSEATAFEATKQTAQGVHFLAVQSSPESEEFAGFWLLQDLNLS